MTMTSMLYTRIPGPSGMYFYIPNTHRGGADAFHTIVSSLSPSEIQVVESIFNTLDLSDIQQADIQVKFKGVTPSNPRNTEDVVRLMKSRLEDGPKALAIYVFQALTKPVELYNLYKNHDWMPPDTLKKKIVDLGWVFREAISADDGCANPLGVVKWVFNRT